MGVTARRCINFRIYTKEFKYVGLVTILKTHKGTYTIRSPSGAPYEDEFIKEVSLYEDELSRGNIISLLEEYENNLDVAYEAQVDIMNNFRTAINEV